MGSFCIDTQLARRIFEEAMKQALFIHSRLYGKHAPNFETLCSIEEDQVCVWQLKVRVILY